MARASGGQIKRKKGEAGAAKNYITRTQAIKKLQCSLSDFRRLCILKGIFPRQPKNHKKANKGSTAPASFYYVKDIQYLLHEPVLQKLRDHKAFAKKLSRAIGRGEWTTAKSLDENKRPKYRLDHIIKERYPSFPDALRDLDDALSLIVLFAHLPASEKVPSSIIANCAKLAAEWQLYVMRTRSLRKVFLSIKGIYFQAEVKGETITWLVPYMFTQNIPSDIDFRIMLTFLELYQTLLGFVFYKLYSDINLVYPPKLDTKSDEDAAGVGALLLEETSRTLTIEGKKGTEEALNKEKKVTAKDVKKQIRSITHHSHADASGNGIEEASEVQEEKNTDAGSVAVVPVNGTTTDIPQPIEGSDLTGQPAEPQRTDLFEGYFFYLSREVTRPTLEFVIRAFGGQVGWDMVLGAGSPYDANDARITHHVIDRPVPTSAPAETPGALTTSSLPGKRAFIQPQWVVDCINARQILPTEPYAPGKTLPPHLSPFVDLQKVREQGGYIPTEAGGEQLAQDEEEDESEEEDDSMEAAEQDGAEVDEEEEFTGFGADTEEAETEQAEEIPESRPALQAAALQPEDEGLRHAAELEAEAHGIAYSTFEKELQDLQKKQAKSSKKQKSAPAALSGAQTQEDNPASILLSNKQRKLFNKMKYSENKRKEEADKLKEKKKSLLKQEKKSKKA